MVKVTFQNLISKRVILELPIDQKILEFKDKILSEYQIDSTKNDIDLIYKGNKVDMSKTLGDINYQESDIITINTKRNKKAPISQPPKQESTIQPNSVSAETQTEFQPQSPNPNQYESEINELMAMGFTREESQAALTRAQGNLRFAATFLLDGGLNTPRQSNSQPIQPNRPSSVPPQAPSPRPASQGPPNNVVQERINLTQMIRQSDDLRRYIMSNRDAHTQVILRALERINPALHEKVVAQPDYFLRFLGVPPPPPEYQANLENDLDRVFNNYTEDQKAVIRRLARRGFDLETVIQIYEICNHNEENAEMMLAGMRA